MQKILIIGATSAIAEATARKFAGNNAKIFLLARDHERLSSLADDLKVRGASMVEIALFDVNVFESHEEVLRRAIATLQGLDLALLAHGTLPDQKSCEESWGQTLAELNTNALSSISLMTHLSNYFEQQGHGSIVVISSVAGDRGRKSNYIYGCAKGAVSIFSQGLRNRLSKSNIQVLLVKPGLVDTPMTKDFKKGMLWAKPDDIARGIMSGIDKKQNVVYLPWFWRWIMLLIKIIPEEIFKKMNL